MRVAVAVIAFGLWCAGAAPSAALTLDLYRVLSDEPRAEHSGLVVRNLYLLSLFDLLFNLSVEAELRGQPPVLCIRDGAARPTGAFLDALLRAKVELVLQHSAAAERARLLRETPAEVVLLDALREEYPCR